MPRPIQATIHTAALRHNLQRARHAAPDARVWAVVKANAYGHGIERAYEGLRGADGFALLDLDEAQRVRELGWRGPVLLLEGVFEPRDLELCSRLDLWHTVHCDEQIDMLAAHKTQQAHRVFLKMNSGMNRLGFTPERFRSAWTRLNALPQVDEISLMTHFSDADGPRGVAHQVDCFVRHTADLPGERTVSNSAATLRHAASLGLKVDWVRPGIAVYGSSPDHPDHLASDWGLQPAMTLQARIIAVQHLQPGDTVGYGSTFTASEAMRIGVVACGYADGYPRLCPTGTPVLVDGVRCRTVGYGSTFSAAAPMRIGVVACGYADGYPRLCPTGTPVLVDGVRSRTVGRVSMDMITVDLSPVPAAGLGSVVTLWGRSAQGEVLPIDQPARAAGTVGYELMCALAPRVPVAVSDD